MSERIPVRMAFVILHYNSIDETRECIRSIRVLNAWPECAAVVVDNASPNGTGKILAEEYAGTDRVEVILNGTNAGFSAGNNAGYRFALEKYDPAFITICNNDVVFPEADYVAQVEAAYAESSFDVLGPDIFQTRLKIHQSPLGLKAPGTAEVRRTILLNTLAKRFFPLFWMLFGKKELRRIANRGDAENWNEVMRDVPLMGACLVFSGRFTQRRGKAFDPETFLYYEEYLLYQSCRKNGFLMVYRPEIRVLHNEGSSTSTDSRNEKERYRKTVARTLDAAKIYLEELKKAE